MMVSANNEALVQALWDNALIGVALLRKDGQFVAANPAFCKLTEYSEAELQTKHYQDLTHPDDAAFDRVMTGELLLGKIRAYDMPKRALTKFGRVITLMSRVAVIRHEVKRAAMPHSPEAVQCVWLLSQIAPLSEYQITAPHEGKQGVPPSVRHAHFWQQVRHYWPMILFAIGIVVSVLVQVHSSLNH
jgi:PAS domain S-box-containing protein